jgi:uncharacterized protein YegL
MFRCVTAVLIGCHCLAGVGWGARVSQHVVVVLDDSGSMANWMQSDRRVTKIDAAKRALLQVLSQVPDDAQVGVLALNSTIPESGSWIIPLGPINRDRVRRAIGGIQAEGGTPLGAAMKQATDALLALRDKQLYGDYRLLIVSDGEAQDEQLVDAYLPEILNRQITVDVIGVSMQQNHSLATRVDRYRRADDPTSLQQAIQQSLAESPLDPQDSDEASDFELLKGLPDSVAAAAIEALSTIDNRPIGEDEDESDDEIAASPSSRPTSGQVRRGTRADRPGRRGTGLSRIAIVGIILVVMIVLKSIKRAGTWRRH